MFPLLFYSILSICTLGCIYIFTKKESSADRRKSDVQRFMRRMNYAFLICITTILWTYQVLLWIVPKGKALHETLRIPYHASHLSAADVSGMKEQTFPYGNHPRQYLMLFEPENGKVTQDRVVYFVHGGSWRYGSPELYRPVAKFFVERGYAVMITAYRLSPQHGYLEMREDLNLSMKKVLTILKSKRWQRKKILLGGDSAGANLAALLLYDRANLKKIGVKQSKFSDFIAFAGPLNLNELSDSKELFEYAGTRTDSTFQMANPINYIQKNEKTPVLCLHGTRDGYVTYASSKTFIQQLNKAQPKLGQMVTFDNYTHLDVIGEWICKKNDVRFFLEKWLEERETRVLN